jgi:hypothetical protein
VLILGGICGNSFIIRLFLKNRNDNSDHRELRPDPKNNVFKYPVS